MPRNGTVRCAIYTRKSSEEGLEQEFNSLQAQREACEAFIVSQRHEGWVCLRAAYDDGGFSGATMARPALQQLLADLTAGRVDTVVVYKIDRLTRSLADFAKIVEILDKGSASFVSVTQQFNTTTSMGRLTLNVLLSFAQFEREGHRRAHPRQDRRLKTKGMWMGGVRAQRVHESRQPHMLTAAQGHDRPQHRQPQEKEVGEFVRPHQRAVEDIARDNPGKEDADLRHHKRCADRFGQNTDGTVGH
jgi:DNA invertase Pin-like site-specific DNA recombinase